MCWRSRAIASSPDNIPRLTLWPKRLLYTAVGLVIIVLSRRAGMSWAYTAAFLSPLVAVEVLFRHLTVKRKQAFERSLMRLIQAGRLTELLPLFYRQRFLHFAAPRSYVQGQLGMIYRKLSLHHHAKAAFKDALEEAPPSQNVPLAVGLADTLLALGENWEAERLYRQVSQGQHCPPHVWVNLARLATARKAEAEEIDHLFQQATQAQRDPLVCCQYGMFLVEQGNLERARQQIQHAQKELAATDNPEALQALQQAQAALAAEEEPAAPDTEETAPDTEEIAPDTEEIAPDTEETAPDTEETAPAAGEETPSSKPAADPIGRS